MSTVLVDVSEVRVSTSRTHTLDPGPLRRDKPQYQHYQRRCLILAALRRAEGQPPPSGIGRCFLIMAVRVNHSTLRRVSPTKTERT